MNSEVSPGYASNKPAVMTYASGMTDSGLMSRWLPADILSVEMNRSEEPAFATDLSRGQLLTLDAVVAAGYTLVLIGILVAGLTAGAAALVPPWAQFLIVLSMGPPLALRRLRPIPVFVVVLAASVLALVLGVVRDGFIAAGLALYIVALVERRPRREPTLLIAALVVVGAFTLVAAGGPAPFVAQAGAILVGSVVLAGSWTVGRAVRERRLYTDRSNAVLVQRAISEERLRIARDLHDIVAHGLSLIVVKAGTANHVMSVRPGEATDALSIIEETGRAALVDMRHMLDVLRSGDMTGESSDLAPSPNLLELPALADRVALAGVHVDLDLRGAQELPEALALSIYRIVQEALTNVVKHAAPARCRVTIAADEGEVRIEIADDGLRAGKTDDRSSQARGYGLIGMRERVRMLGGEITAGPQPQHGFRVFARIPCAPHVAPAAEPQ